MFEIVLGGLRTYVLTHTTSRVDVELGAGLFRHLLGLPLAYFESRPVGQTVARVHELETIRNFLTGSAVTLVLDLLFTVVFLAVMYWYSPTLTYVVLGSIPFDVLVSVAITPGLRRRVEEKFRRGAANQAFLVEAITGVETLKSMSVEPQMRQRWEEQLAAHGALRPAASVAGRVSREAAVSGESDGHRARGARGGAAPSRGGPQPRGARVPARGAGSAGVEAFPFTRYGLIDGEVVHLSADAVVDETLGPVYPMKVRLAEERVRVGDRLVGLSPGMTVAAEIKTGKRRAIEFFLAPLLRYRSEALRER